MCVRDLLSRAVFARGDGTHTLQQSTTLKEDMMRASDKMDSCNIRAALQILQTSVRAPQNLQTAAGVLLFRQMNTRLCGSKCSVQRSSRLLRNSRPHQRSW